MSAFVQRSVAPDENNRFYYADNPFHASGYGLPNCTCYAWGRFYEISGERPTLGLGNAEDWYAYPDGYERGTTPRLGAVLCWRKGQAGNNADGAGHVEIVEQINSDGTIITSGSAYNGYLFRRKTRNPSANWDGGDYIFQGFIYNPATFTGSDVVTPISGNRYLNRTEMENNARYIWNYLSGHGWTMNAVAGMLGNMQTESSINPGIWQGLNEGNLSGGFGLTQWTPATKLINWANNNGLDYADMDTQLKRIIWEQETENGQYTGVGNYPVTFTEFKISQANPGFLGMAFLECYERPLDPNQPNRRTQAQEWYDFLSGLPTEDGKKKRKGLPLIFMYMATRRRM